jgi:HTH-type transcriptional regulator/antitoxin HigA
MLVVEGALGRAVVAELRRRGLSLDELATTLDMSTGRLSAYLSGARRPNRDLADGLARALGDAPEDWLRLGARLPAGDAVTSPWVQAVSDYRPETLKVLRERGLVTARRNQQERLALELGEFFRCEPGSVAELVPASFKQSTAHPAARDAVDVWLRLADQQAEFVAELEGVPSIDGSALRELLPELLKVGDRQPPEYLPEVKEKLADVGVVLVFQPDVPGTRLSGASWPTGEGHGVLATTLRYRTDDWFWWTLFHECAHLLLGHGLVLDSVDAEDYRTGEEEAADELARELLLAPGWDDGLTKVSKDRVSAKAKQLGVPAGVVVGQLQKRRGLQQHHLRQLKKTMPDTAALEVGGLPQSGGRVWEAAVAELLNEAPPQS